MADDFDPYYIWLGIPPREQPADHYRLLGVARFEPDADVIAHAADARMTFLRTFQTTLFSAAGGLVDPFDFVPYFTIFLRTGFGHLPRRPKTKPRKPLAYRLQAGSLRCGGRH